MHTYQIQPAHLHQTVSSRLQQLLYHWKLCMSYHTVVVSSLWGLYTARRWDGGHNWWVHTETSAPDYSDNINEPLFCVTMLPIRV